MVVLELVMGMACDHVVSFCQQSEDFGARGVRPMSLQGSLSEAPEMACYLVLRRRVMARLRQSSCTHKIQIISN